MHSKRHHSEQKSPWEYFVLYAVHHIWHTFWSSTHNIFFQPPPTNYIVVWSLCPYQHLASCLNCHTCWLRQCQARPLSSTTTTSNNIIVNFLCPYQKLAYSATCLYRDTLASRPLKAAQIYLSMPPLSIYRWLRCSDAFTSHPLKTAQGFQALPLLSMSRN